jgi:hypothetical protein
MKQILIAVLMLVSFNAFADSAEVVTYPIAQEEIVKVYDSTASNVNKVEDELSLGTPSRTEVAIVRGIVVGGIIAGIAVAASVVGTTTAALVGGTAAGLYAYHSSKEMITKAPVIEKQFN